MPDGKTPSSFEYNVEATREVVEMAHAKGVTVEGEIGCLGGIEDGHGAGLDGLSHLTDPAQAAEFVKLTGLDALAIAIGTSHGAYKFSSKPTGETLKMDRLIEIHKRLPNVHLVMHGSSSVPKDLQDIINQYGGKLKPTWGVPVEEIQLGIKNGVRKINVDTDNRLAITGAIRKVFAEKPEEFDPRSYMKPAREAMKKVVALAHDAVRPSRPRRRLRADFAGRDGGTVSASSRVTTWRSLSGASQGRRFPTLGTLPGVRQKASRRARDAAGTSAGATLQPTAQSPPPSSACPARCPRNTRPPLRLR